MGPRMNEEKSNTEEEQVLILQFGERPTGCIGISDQSEILCLETRVCTHRVWRGLRYNVTSEEEEHRTSTRGLGIDKTSAHSQSELAAQSQITAQGAMWRLLVANTKQVSCCKGPALRS